MNEYENYILIIVYNDIVIPLNILPTLLRISALLEITRIHFLGAFVNVSSTELK